MRGGFPLFRFRGIQVLLHWTFLLLPAYIGITGFMGGSPLREVLVMMAEVLVLFVCVVMHEFGHALTAQHYGVRTRDITLLPIGGLASLERMPEEPRQEFWITVAGPAVNLVIAGLAFALIAITGITVRMNALVADVSWWNTALNFLLLSNIGLLLFNLIPAFPMDGGRILRSLLSMRLTREKATRIAATIGRVFAVGFVLYGFMESQPFLAIIGLFIFMAAGSEARMVQQQAALRGMRARHVMRTRFWSMPATATVQQAVDELLAGGDSDLVVLQDGRYAGMLTRRDLVQALSDQRQQALLSELPVQPVPPVGPEVDVNTAYQVLVTGKYPMVPVMHGDELLGVLENENLAEFLQVQEARTGGRRPA